MVLALGPHEVFDASNRSGKRYKECEREPSEEEPRCGIPPLVQVCPAESEENDRHRDDPAELPDETGPVDEAGSCWLLASSFWTLALLALSRIEGSERQRVEGLVAGR